MYSSQSWETGIGGSNVPFPKLGNGHWEGERAIPKLENDDRRAHCCTPRFGDESLQKQRRRAVGLVSFGMGYFSLMQYFFRVA